MSAFGHLSETLPKLATVEEVAEALVLSKKTVVRQCRQGEIPAVKHGHRWLILVDRLAEQLGTPFPAPSALRSSDNAADASGAGETPGPAERGVPPVRGSSSVSTAQCASAMTSHAPPRGAAAGNPSGPTAGGLSHLRRVR